MNETGIAALTVTEGLPEQREQFVYMFYSAGKIKIGTTTDIYRRLSDFQTGATSTFYFVWAAHGGRAYEKKLHKLFASDRLHGEWFRLSDAFRGFMVWNDNLPGRDSAKKFFQNRLAFAESDPFPLPAPHTGSGT